MGTETRPFVELQSLFLQMQVKLNNPLMGTETYIPRI